MSYFESITKDLVNVFVKEINKKENKQKLNTYVINPLIKEIVSKSYAYAISHVVLQIIIIGLLLLILIKIKK
jgi:hypothetical protein